MHVQNTPSFTHKHTYKHPLTHTSTLREAGFLLIFCVWKNRLILSFENQKIKHNINHFTLFFCPSGFLFQENKNVFFFFLDTRPIGPALNVHVHIRFFFFFFEELHLGLQHITHSTHRQRRVPAKGELLQWCQRKSE